MNNTHDIGWSAHQPKSTTLRDWLVTIAGIVAYFVLIALLPA